MKNNNGYNPDDKYSPNYEIRENAYQDMATKRMLEKMSPGGISLDTKKEYDRASNTRFAHLTKEQLSELKTEHAIVDIGYKPEDKYALDPETRAQALDKIQQITTLEKETLGSKSPFNKIEHDRAVESRSKTPAELAGLKAKHDKEDGKIPQQRLGDYSGFGSSSPETKGLPTPKPENQKKDFALQVRMSKGPGKGGPGIG